MTNIIQAEEDRRAFAELSAATGLSPEHARDVLDAMTDCYVVPTLAPKRPLGRVARIFHRRGMWSVSAAMLAHEPDETPAQAKMSDDSALPQP